MLTSVGPEYLERFFGFSPPAESNNALAQTGMKCQEVNGLWIDLNENQQKNKDTPPAMTPRNFTFFPAARSSVLQPFQGFVTFAF